MATVMPMQICMTATELQDVLMTLTTGFGLMANGFIASGQVEQISPLFQVSIIGFVTSIHKEPNINNRLYKLL